MIYFVKITSTYQARNQLQSAVLKRLASYNHIVIDSPQGLADSIRRIVESLNRKFPRSTPLVVQFDVTERQLSIRTNTVRHGNYEYTMTYGIAPITGYFKTGTREFLPCTESQLKLLLDPS